VTGNDNIAVNIDSSTHVVSLVPDSGWYGSNYVVIYVNDSEYTNQSNNVTFTVYENPPVTVSTPVTTPTPRTVAFSISVPDVVYIQEKKSNMAKVVLTNDGQVDVSGINITLSTGGEENITLKLQDSYIQKLSSGNNFTTWLNITTGELEVNKTYMVTLTARSESPSLTRVATIPLKPIATNKTFTEVEIILVRDMFEENPECMELFDLILEAEESLASENLAEAKRLTSLAVEHCQDLIDYASTHKPEVPADVPEAGSGFELFMHPVFVMLFVVVLLALSMAGFWMSSKRR